MTFRVGQKVVCVDDGLGLTGVLIPPCGLPVIGVIYTVTQVGPNFLRGIGLNVAECEHPISCGWRASRFRPIAERKTDISIFTKMLTDTKIGADA